MTSKGRVLVTGGAGFLGSHIVDRALAEGYEVVCLDNLYTGTRDNFAHHLDNKAFRFVHHDVKHPLPSDVTLTGAPYVLIFHMACAASPTHYQNDPIGTTLTCVNGTYHVLQLATQHACPVLIASTSEVYGDPLEHPQKETYWGNTHCNGIRSCYDEGKRCAESLCFDFYRRYGTKIRVARIFNTYGPRMCFNDDRVVTNFILQALEGRDITVYGTGDNTRSFQYVDDLIEGFWRLIHHPSEPGPVNLGNPDEYTIRELAEKVIRLVPNTTSTIVSLPPVEDDPKRRNPDITKAKALLNWEPHVHVDVGLQRTLDDIVARKKRLATQHQDTSRSSSSSHD